MPYGHTQYILMFDLSFSDKTKPIMQSQGERSVNYRPLQPVLDRDEADRIHKPCANVGRNVNL
jgi:hypothetical protein